MPYATAQSTATSQHTRMKCYSDLNFTEYVQHEALMANVHWSVFHSLRFMLAYQFSHLTSRDDLCH